MNFNSIPPITRNLLIINVVVYFLSVTVMPGDLAVRLSAFFPTSPYFEPFQIITHMFMHGGIGHLFFNMFAVWMFGSTIELFFGAKKYVILYFISGLAAYLLHEGVSYFAYQDNLEALNIIRVVGASGCLFGVMAAFAVVYPNTPLMLMFIPVPIKAKYFIGGYMLIELFSGINPSNDGVAHFAHIGGGIAGFLLAKYWMKNRYRIN